MLTALARVVQRGKQLRIAYHGANTGTTEALTATNLMGHATAIHPRGSHLMHLKFLVRDAKAV